MTLWLNPKKLPKSLVKYLKNSKKKNSNITLICIYIKNEQFSNE